MFDKNQRDVATIAKFRLFYNLIQNINKLIGIIC